MINNKDFIIIFIVNLIVNFAYKKPRNIEVPGRSQI